jgi:tRNA (adenine37-N6)-methyltransferase
MTFDMRPVAVVSTARRSPEDDYWGGEQSCIMLAPELPPDALAGLDAFSHVEIVFVFHAVESAKIVTGARRPRNNPDWPAVGIFAQRAKNRPNRIGCTICPIERVTDRMLYVRELDAIDGTPVLDLKPVMTEFLPRSGVRQPAWASELMQHYWSSPVE